MSSAADENIGKYKAGFTNKSQKKDFVKTTPLKIVPGYAPEQLKSIGAGVYKSHPANIKSKQ